MKGVDVAFDGCSPSWTSSGQRRVKSWINVENFHNDVFHLQPLDKEFEGKHRDVLLKQLQSDK
jgi:hypothetical protein